MDRGLSREERLRGLSTIRLLFENGNQGFCYPLRYIWHIAPIEDERDGMGEDIDSKAESIGKGRAEGYVSTLFSIPKRNIRRANKRNLLKRRCRESFRLNKGTLFSEDTKSPLKLNIALIYSSKEVLEYKTINRAVQKILKEISKATQTSSGSTTNPTR